VAITSQALNGIRGAAEKSLFYFCRSVLGLKFLSPILHQEVCQFLSPPPNADIAQKHKKLLMIPRDFAKTTLEKAEILHQLIQPEENNIYFPGIPGTDTRTIIAGETSRNSSRHLRNIETVIEKNSLFQALWPHIKPGRKWSEHEMEVIRTTNYSEPTVEALGVDTAIASRHVDHIFCDDIFTFAASQSSTLAETCRLWFKSLDAVLDDTENQSARLTVVGTPWALNDIYKEILDINQEMTAEGMEPEYDVYIRSAIEAGESIWPERFPLEKLKYIEFRLRGTGRWSLNYMCQYEDGEFNDLKVSWLQRATLKDGVLTLG
jgi:hypothetical protein